MRSYVVTEWDHPMELQEHEAPVPVGDEVLVRVMAAGVCHSDLHIYEGFYDLGGGKKLRNADRGVHAPLTLGHEIAGIVEAIGPDVDQLEIGTEVGVYPWIGCGHCDACAIGQEQNCPHMKTLGIFNDGGYSTHVLVPASQYCVPLDGVDPNVAALYACSGITTYHALRKFPPDLLTREPLLIVGAGGLGLMALTIHRALGGFGAIVADIDPAKRDLAISHGAMAAIDSRDDGALEQIRALSSSGRGLRMAIDLVGSGATLQLAIDSLVKGGKVVSVGLMGGEITVPTPYFPMRALTIEGSYVGTLQEMRELLALARDHDLQPPPIETHPLDDAQTVLDNLRAGKVNGRGVLVP